MNFFLSAVRTGDLDLSLFLGNSDELTAALASEDLVGFAVIPFGLVELDEFAELAVLFAAGIFLGGEEAE